MRTTIAAVSPQPRYWEQGQTYFVQGAFADDSEWSLGFKSEDKAVAAVAALKDLIGKEEEYELEPKPDRNGRKQWKLRNYPGKPQVPAFGGGKGGREYVPRYRDTEQGAKEERLSIARSVALQQAVILHKGSTDESGLAILATADGFYGWLSRTQPLPTQPAGMQEAANSGENSRPPAQSGDTPPAARTYQRPPCPKCGSAETVFQEKDKNTGQYVPGSFYCWKTKGGCGHQWKDMGELAAQLGIQRGDQIQSLTEVIQAEIDKAVKAKNLTHLQAVEDRVTQRLDEGKLTLDQASAISRDIGVARKIIQSAANQTQFHDRKVQEAQQQLQLQQGQEMQHPSSDEAPF